MIDQYFDTELFVFYHSPADSEGKDQHVYRDDVLNLIKDELQYNLRSHLAQYQISYHDDYTRWLVNLYPQSKSFQQNQYYINQADIYDHIKILQDLERERKGYVPVIVHLVAKKVNRKGWIVVKEPWEVRELNKVIPGWVREQRQIPNKK